MYQLTHNEYNRKTIHISIINNKLLLIDKYIKSNNIYEVLIAKSKFYR